MRTGRRVIDHGGVGIGVATDEGDVYDHAGVHIASVDALGDVYDLAGVRIGRLAGDPARSGPVAAEAELAGAGVR